MQESGTAVSRRWSLVGGTIQRKLHRIYGCQCDPGTEGPGTATETTEQWLKTAGGQRWQLVTASLVLRGSTAQMNVQAEAIQSDLNN